MDSCVASPTSNQFFTSAAFCLLSPLVQLETQSVRGNSIAASVAKGSRLDVIANGYQWVVSNGLLKASPCSCTHVVHLCMHMIGRFMCQFEGSLLSKIGTFGCRSLLIAVTKI